MAKGRKKDHKPPIVVVYKKPTGKKSYMQVFGDITVDDVIDSRKNKPPIPDNFIIQEIGLGNAFIEIYKKQYKIKKITQ